MDPMIEISRRCCERCPKGLDVGDPIFRCTRADGADCPEQKKIDEINEVAEIEIILH
jgi:hypothetical protein